MLAVMGEHFKGRLTRYVSAKAEAAAKEPKAEWLKAMAAKLESEDGEDPPWKLAGARSSGTPLPSFRLRALRTGMPAFDLVAARYGTLSMQADTSNAQSQQCLTLRVPELDRSF